MKQKNIKVAYKSRSTGGSYTQVPKIQLEGRWLEELGFSIGSTIVVEYGDGVLHVRPMTAEELADRQRVDVFWRAFFSIFVVMIPYNQRCIFMRFYRISIHYRKFKDAFAPLSRLKSLILR